MNLGLGVHCLLLPSVSQHAAGRVGHWPEWEWGQCHWTWGRPSLSAGVVLVSTQRALFDPVISVSDAEAMGSTVCKRPAVQGHWALAWAGGRPSLPLPQASPGAGGRAAEQLMASWLLSPVTPIPLLLSLRGAFLDMLSLKLWDSSLNCLPSKAQAFGNPSPGPLYFSLCLCHSFPEAKGTGHPS